MNILSAMLPAWQAAFDKIRDHESCALFEMSEGQRVPFACRALRETGRPVIYVSSGEKQAMHVADDAGVWLEDRAAMLPARENTFAHMTGGREKEIQRLSILSRAVRGEITFLSISAETLLQPMMPLARFKEACVTIGVGDETEPGVLIDRLLRCGYTRADMVEGRGQCALRGEIVDVFPPDQLTAIRIEFFDTEVDSIRRFDCISQRSDERLDEVTICPAYEFLIPEGEGARVASAMREAIRAQSARLPRDVLEGGRFDFDDGDEAESDPAVIFERGNVPRALRTGLSGMADDAEEAEKGFPFSQLPLWAGTVYPRPELLADWLQDCVLVFDYPENAIGRCRDREAGFAEELKAAMEHGQAVPEMLGAQWSVDEMLPRLRQFTLITLQEFLHGTSGLIDQASAPLKLESTPAPRYDSRIKELA